MPQNPLPELEILDLFASKTIVVFGDVMLDRYVYGHVDRISPESPVPILVQDRENQMLGGAGNTATNITTLGARARLVSLIGADSAGENIRAMAKNLSMEHTGLLTEDTYHTIVKTRFLAGHQQLLRTDLERAFVASPEIDARLLSALKAALNEADALILSDYGKGLLTRERIQAAITMANDSGIPTLVDPKGRDYTLYRGAKIVTPNKKELSEATTGKPLSSDEDIITVSQNLIEACGIAAIIATRSREGMSVITAQETTHIRPAAQVEVFDVSGAGDTVIATLACALASGASLVRAAALANLAGSIVVTKIGTAPIRAEDLRLALLAHDVAGDIDSPNTIAQSGQARIETWHSAGETIARWKARGLKVGFTNGCFDIVHHGHVSYLNAARKKCDKLVVGLNTDTSVKMLKGPHRPIHDQNARASVIGALGCVDMVVLFGAETPAQPNTANALIEEIKPDIYFKGGDYTIAQIPEAPSMRSVGGVVEIMPVFEGFSTTGAIAKIKASS